MNLKRAFLILLAAMILPGVALAQDYSIGMTATVDFTDSNADAMITVDFSCNDGISPTGQALLGDGDSFRHPNAGMTSTFICTVTASSVDNYSTPTACEFDVTDMGEGTSAEVTCAFTFSPDGATIIVSKTWNTEGAGGNEVDTEARIEARAAMGVLVDGVMCDEYVMPVGAADLPMPTVECEYLVLEGNDAAPVLVNTDVDGASVMFSETDTDSSIEVSMDCGTDGVVTVFPGDEEDCDFTNTVFFEGIPTLSQYGMAIMALLMLSVGFVGFRRFV